VVRSLRGKGTLDGTMRQRVGLRDKPSRLTVAPKYTALNGIAYLVVGAILIVWPDVTQTVFREPAFAGHEQALMRVIGLTVAVIGWLYFFGRRSGARQFIAASVIDRLVFVPAVLIPLAIAAVFPRLFLTFTIIDHCWQSARGCCLLASESPPWVR
jgi:hypothetical protein